MSGDTAVGALLDEFDDGMPDPHGNSKTPLARVNVMKLGRKRGASANAAKARDRRAYTPSEPDDV